MRKPSLGELSKVKEMLLPGIGWHLWNTSVRCRGCLVLHGVAPYNDFSSRVCFSGLRDFLSFFQQTYLGTHPGVPLLVLLKLLFLCSGPGAKMTMVLE